MFVEKNLDVYSVKQKPWLKVYTDFYKSTRAAAENYFDKDLPKFMNISFYGKTIESVRSRLEVKLTEKEWWW